MNKKITLGLLVLAAIFSGHARQLLQIASNASVSDTMAGGSREGTGGATCRG